MDIRPELLLFPLFADGPSFFVAQELVCRDVSELLTVLELPHSVRSRTAQGAVTIDIVLPDHQVRAGDMIAHSAVDYAWLLHF